jgi:hypothetical protein
VTVIASKAAALIRNLGVTCESGLSDGELRRIETEGQFRFNPDHREFLRLCLPIGASWPQWREATQSDIRKWLFWPIDGVLFDVMQNDFWAADWGVRPLKSDASQEVARRHMMQAPKLVPIYSHRHCVAAPAPSGSPVFSVHQTDTIYYGRDLADYFTHEFLSSSQPIGSVDVEVPFWSLLAEWVPTEDELLTGRIFWNRGPTSQTDV